MTEEQFDNIISEIDTVIGMLMVPSMNDQLVKQAMEKLSSVSIKLGELGEEMSM